MTGSGAPAPPAPPPCGGSAASGTSTVSCRQSSPPMSRAPSSLSCGHGVVGAVTFSGATHGAGGCGAAKRSAPTGGAAKGTDEKRARPPEVSPTTGPERVCTTGATAAAEAAAAAANAATTDDAAVRSRCCMFARSDSFTNLNYRLKHG